MDVERAQDGSSTLVESPASEFFVAQSALDIVVPTPSYSIDEKLLAEIDSWATTHVTSTETPNSYNNVDPVARPVARRQQLVNQLNSFVQEGTSPEDLRNLMMKMSSYTDNPIPNL